MTQTQQIITIAMVVLGTILTRFLPFWIFPPNRPTPKFVQYLGRVLPAAALWSVGCILPEGCKHMDKPAWTAGIDCDSLHCFSACLEAKYAAFYCRRNGYLYAFGTFCFLICGFL